MKKIGNQFISEWSISENTYHPANESTGGTQFSIGNGYMGLRGSYEELGTKFVQGFFVERIFRKSIVRFFAPADTFCRKKYIFNEELMPTALEAYKLQNLPDTLYCKIWLDGQPFRLWDGKLLEYNRSLDLRTGLLSRTVKWNDGNGKITSLTFRRFCSMSDRHLIAQEITITPENWSGKISIESGIDASLNDDDYLESVAKETSAGLVLKSEIRGGANIFQAMKNNLINNSNKWDYKTELRRHKKIITINGRQKQTIRLEKFSTVYSSFDKNPQEKAEALVAESSTLNFEGCLKKNSEAWRKIWNQADIKIDGDIEAQGKIRFALFHLIIASPQTNSNISIGAKSLSGQGYCGHVFWDTDIALSPFYQWIFPEWAKSHVKYRHKMLDAAKKYAKSENRSGARYPWQSSIEGFEHAPISITCSRTQIHITTDVAYCVIRYADITGDTQWMKTEGKEIVTECARYMAERVEYNETKDCYEILGVGGPDEYHPVTDNNAYTNYLTAYVLRRAAALCDDKNEADEWLKIAGKIYCPVDEKTGLIPQCDGFYDLKDSWEETGGTWGGPGAEYHECKGMKQPDVILLLTLLSESFQKKHFQANWDYYERFILHGSSLSPSIHALVAAKLGLMDKAMEYFNLSTEFDFVNYNNDTEHGIHIGNFGGLWQTMVYGFAGMVLRDGELCFDPHLPANWTSLEFNLRFRGESLQIRIADGKATVSFVPCG
ncbi:glycoside hydrolase family 65 protein [bacterium]|nr:glycoside hydrolase family 65 protein [bacterium]